MSEEQCATARAQGALDSFLEKMGVEMLDKQRSKEYINTFWNALDEYMKKGIYNG